MVFILIAVNAENAASHRYVETNARSAVTAESDNDRCSPNAKPNNVKLFPRKFKLQLKSQKIDQLALPEI